MRKNGMNNFTDSRKERTGLVFTVTNPDHNINSSIKNHQGTWISVRIYRSQAHPSRHLQADATSGFTARTRNIEEIAVSRSDISIRYLGTFRVKCADEQYAGFSQNTRIFRIFTVRVIPLRILFRRHYLPRCSSGNPDNPGIIP